MNSDPKIEHFRERVRRLMPAAQSDLTHLVSYCSVADPALGPTRGNSSAALFLEDELRQAGLRIKSRTMPDGTTTVIATASGRKPDAPKVLLYSHYDVQPAGDETAWISDPWTLTERDGRWYGRGAADAKGNIIAHLTALRALEEEFDCALTVVLEGSEEWASPGLETFVRQTPDLLAADAILLADCGSPAVNEPALTTTLRGSVIVLVTVSTLQAPVHSGTFGGAAPDALAALVRMLNSLWDERGNALVTEERALSQWTGSDTGPTEARFRRDAGVLDGVDLMGDGELTDRIWLRPAITVLGIDCPSVVGSLPAIPATVRARISVRVPPGMSGQEAEKALINRLREVAPWNAVVEIETQAVSEPFSRRADGPAFSTLRESLRDAYKREPTEVGQGGAIPVCGAFSDAYPDAEILLFGVEEPQCAIHSPNESVDPSEIERIALAECLFLSRYSHAQTDE